MAKCPFCDKRMLEKEEVVSNKTCIFLQGKGYNHEGVLEGSGVIITKAHKESPFELTNEEMIDVLDLLKKAKSYLDKKYKPDGYSVGWNVGKASDQKIPHVHLHMMPRYNDEPLAGKGIRYFLKQKDNARPKG